jgi:RHS repeat-associated protein
MRVGAPADSNYSLGAGGVILFGRNVVVTTTYAYDAFGQRVLQTGTTTTYLYPFKWYSVAPSTGTGAKYATTTDYVFNGDSLVATADQQTASGNATGTAKTRYVHPDHLGSTNVVTDENDNITQTLDYYPYGALRISVSTSTNEQRKFIGQFSDQSNLDYLNARYYNGTQGQFTSQDPVFLGDAKQQQLQDPQSLNAYSYSEDNPITKSDPNGKLSTAPAYYFAPEEILAGPVGWGLLGLTAIGTGVIVAENAPRVQPTAPGSQRVFQESIGQGYNTDPNTPDRLYGHRAGNDDMVALVDDLFDMIKQELPFGVEVHSLLKPGSCCLAELTYCRVDALLVQHRNTFDQLDFPQFELVPPFVERDVFIHVHFLGASARDVPVSAICRTSDGKKVSSRRYPGHPHEQSPLADKRPAQSGQRRAGLRDPAAVG